MSIATADSLGGAVRRGLAWSTVNSLLLRAGNLLLGMALARLLEPKQFGVYAIALTVQTMLMAFSDLGMSIDLIRAEHPERRAPTVATLGLLSGILLALLMICTATPLASLIGTPDAAGVIMVLSLTLIVNGAGVVPYGQLQRRFEQRKLFACTAVDLVVGSTVTIGLIALGMGPMALAIGRVLGQLTDTSLQFLLSGLRLRFGLDRAVARSALGYGVPLASANLLSWALLNIDTVVIARVAGVTSLGFYVLAFNISNWPINSISQAIRGVSLAGFARASREGDDGGLVPALSLAWAAAVPVGVLLAALAHPLVTVLYGSRWGASAAVLAALGFFGGLRVALDLVATYLMARGAARPVLYVQIIWFVALIPAVVVGTHWQGIEGAAWAHLVVGVLVVLPAYAIALHRAGTPPRTLLRPLWPALLAGVPTWWVGHSVATAIDPPILGLLLGGLAGSATYAALSYRRIQRLLPDRERKSRPRGLVDGLEAAA
jgi:PST family polysaccharide transporter